MEKSSTSLPYSESDEIDLRQLLVSVWEGKWLISSITTLSFLLGVFYIYLVPQKYSVGFTLSPISTFNFNSYAELNAIDFFKVSPNSLLGLLSEELKERESFIDAIESSKLIEREDYETEEDYQEALFRMAYDFKIKILEPVSVPENLDNKINREELEQNKGWRIEYKGAMDKKKLLSVLKKTLLSSNEKVRKFLETQFWEKVKINRKVNQYTLEDIEKAVKNAKDDYVTKTSNRLEFLLEQASIAHALNIQKNTIEAQPFSATTSFVANVKTDSPFYLRGYEAIEKEIDLIKTRKNTDAFIPDLLDLIIKKRTIEQNSKIDRSIAAFQLSPIQSQTYFKSARFDIMSAGIEYTTNPSVIAFLSILLGGMMSLLILFIKNAIKSTSKNPL